MSDWQTFAVYSEGPYTAVSPRYAQAIKAMEDHNRLATFRSSKQLLEVLDRLLGEEKAFNQAAELAKAWRKLETLWRTAKENEEGYFYVHASHGQKERNAIGLCEAIAFFEDCQVFTEELRGAMEGHIREHAPGLRPSGYAWSLCEAGAENRVKFCRQMAEKMEARCKELECKSETDS